ncbi:MAG: hypothetical protein HFJ45_02495 [Clostridia bacterium]|nr:hypothetical protein [Clostridia bacterium]
MGNEEILNLWKKGISKTVIAKEYQRAYNQRIKAIRSELVNRHWGNFISYREALAVVEKVIYKEVIKNDKNNK